jgi:hypothetical protein
MPPAANFLEKVRSKTFEWRFAHSIVKSVIPECFYRGPSVLNPRHPRVMGFEPITRSPRRSATDGALKTETPNPTALSLKSECHDLPLFLPFYP